MSITYPLTPPSGGVARATIRQVANVAVSRSVFTGEQQVQRWQGERWEFDLDLALMERPTAQAWAMFLAKMYGSYGTALIGDPAYLAAGPRGIATGTPLVNGGGQSGDTLATDGWTNGVTGILKAGDYIQLGTGATSRLHVVLDDANSSGGGAASLNIWPRLREAPANNSAIVVAGARGLFRLAGPQTQYDIDVALNYGFRIAFTEAL